MLSFLLNSVLFIVSMHFGLSKKVLLTSSCGAGRIELRRFVGGMVLGIAPYFPLCYIVFPN